MNLSPVISYVVGLRTREFRHDGGAVQQNGWESTNCMAAHAGLTLGQNLVNSHPIPFGWFVITFWAAAALTTFLSRPRPTASHRSNRLRSEYP